MEKATRGRGDFDSNKKTYVIIRVSSDARGGVGKETVVARGQTLDQALAFCNNPVELDAFGTSALFYRFEEDVKQVRTPWQSVLSGKIKLFIKTALWRKKQGNWISKR